MIQSVERKYIYISTPKTGTHSFYKLLQDEFDGERVGHQYHRTELPSIKESEYTIFSTVRNPYDRLIAMWNSLLFSKPDVHNYRDSWLKVLKKDDLLTFSAFIEKHKDDIERVAHARLPMLMIPQHRWYNRMPDKTIPLHLENISVEFHNLPFVDKEVNIPHMLKRNHASWDELKSDEITELANSWAGNDFEKFGYEKEGV